MLFIPHVYTNAASRNSGSALKETDSKDYLRPREMENNTEESRDPKKKKEKQRKTKPIKICVLNP